MNYTAIILSILLISVSYIIYETDSVYAMQTIKSNWDRIIHPFETSETEKEANMILRDSKATSFVPTFTFKTDNTISNNYDFSNRHNTRIHHLN